VSPLTQGLRYRAACDGFLVFTGRVSEKKKLNTKHNYNEKQHKKRKQPDKKTTDMCTLQLMKLKPGLEAFYAILCGNGS